MNGCGSVILWFCCCLSDNEVVSERVSPYDPRIEIELTEENLKKAQNLTRKQSLDWSIKKARSKAENMDDSSQERE